MHLHDLVTEDRDQVRFLTTFVDFTTLAIPRDLATSHEFRWRSNQFVRARKPAHTLWDATR
jgi:hypothetical protein